MHCWHNDATSNHDISCCPGHQKHCIMATRVIRYVVIKSLRIAPLDQTGFPPALVRCPGRCAMSRDKRRAYFQDRSGMRREHTGRKDVDPIFPTFAWILSSSPSNSCFLLIGLRRPKGAYTEVKEQKSSYLKEAS